VVDEMVGAEVGVVPSDLDDRPAAADPALHLTLPR
jgi:hypothetical protein